MIARAARRLGCRLEAKAPEVETINKDIDDPHRAVFADIVIEMLRKKGGLSAILALYKSAHQTPSRRKV